MMKKRKKEENDDENNEIQQTSKPCHVFKGPGSLQNQIKFWTLSSEFSCSKTFIANVTSFLSSITI